MAARKQSVAEHSTTSSPAPADDVEAGPSLSIGELAKRTGVSTRTIRYYEELGILPLRADRRVGLGAIRVTTSSTSRAPGSSSSSGSVCEEIAELGQFALTGSFSASTRTQAILTGEALRARTPDQGAQPPLRARQRSRHVVAFGETAGSPVLELLRWVGEGKGRVGPRRGELLNRNHSLNLPAGALVPQMERTLFESDHSDFRDAVRQFVKRHVTPEYDRWEAEGIVDRQLWDLAGGAGLLGLDVPEEYGGGGSRTSATTPCWSRSRPCRCAPAGSASDCTTTSSRRTCAN